MRRLPLLLALIPVVAHAADARLEAIRTLIEPMRAAKPGAPVRGAVPALTEVKHRLRDWIESRLPILQWREGRWTSSPAILQEQLNKEITLAGLTCGQSTSSPCDSEGTAGYLGDIELELQHNSILIVKTSMQIQVCGEDQSAYAYRSSNDQWQRFWQTEQNDYREGKYFPRRFHVVQVSPSDYSPKADRSRHIILTVGTEPWCTSAWHDIYHEVWLTSSSAEPQLLLSDSEWGYIADGVLGAVDRQNVYVQYHLPGIEGGFTRPEIRHYTIEESELKRVEPVALSPRDFVAFWLRTPPEKRHPWTDPVSTANIAEWARITRGQLSEFGTPTLHCVTPDLWQLYTTAGTKEDKDVYFLIRWRPPYRFTMVSVADRPWPNCKEPDPVADEPKSLFLNK